MLRAAIKGALARKLRLILTGIAVILGVSFVSGTYIYTDTVSKAFDNLFADINQGVDLAVRARSGFGSNAEAFSERERVPASLLDRIRDIDGVAVADGSVAGYAQIVDKRGKPIQPMGPPTLGVAWEHSDRLTALHLRDGRKPRTAHEIAIDASTAKEHGFHVGDRVTVLLLDVPRKTYRLVGIAGFGTEDNLAGATLVAFDPRTAQTVLGAHGAYDVIEVGLARGVDLRRVRAAIGQLLAPYGDHYEVVTGEQSAGENSRSIADQLGFINTALLVFAAVALLVGAFIIANTFSIVVAQRSRELALLRAIGASRGQVIASVVVEALLVGMLASVAGAVGGIGIAGGLRALMEAFNIDLPQTALQIEPRTIVVSLAVGMVVTVVSAVYPAVRASRVAPVEAMRDETQRVHHRRRWVGAVRLVSLFGGVAILAWGLSAGELKVIGAGAGLTFLGVALMSPVLVVPMARAIGAPAAAWRGVAGALARENAMRTPVRTAATAIALMVGLALVGFVSIFAASLRASVDETIDRTFTADLVIASAAANTGGGFSPSAALRMAKLDEVGTVSALQFGQVRIGSHKRATFAMAADGATLAKVIALDVTSGRVADLDGDTMMASERRARSNRWRVGDDVPVRFARTGRHHLKLVAIYASTGSVGDIVLSSDAYRKNFLNRLDITVYVTARRGVSQRRLRAAVERELKPFPNLDVRSQAEYAASQRTLVNQVLGLITALIALSVIVAILGIVNTLALSVFERTHEIGLLRAVGMSRRQVRSMIRWESVTIAVIGALLGIALGLLFGWLIVRSLEEEGITAFAIPTGSLVIYVLLAAVAGLLAAIFPARRAARLNVLQAISTE